MDALLTQLKRRIQADPDNEGLLKRCAALMRRLKIYEPAYILARVYPSAFMIFARHKAAISKGGGPWHLVVDTEECHPTLVEVTGDFYIKERPGIKIACSLGVRNRNNYKVIEQANAPLETCKSCYRSGYMNFIKFRPVPSDVFDHSEHQQAHGWDWMGKRYGKTERKYNDRTDWMFANKHCSRVALRKPKFWEDAVTANAT